MSPITFIAQKLPIGLLTTFVSAAILWLTLAPHPVPEPQIQLFEGADKVVHALMFAGLYFAIYFDCSLRRKRVSGLPATFTWRLFLLITAICITAGGVIELAQNAMHLGRGADIYDWLSDATGPLIAAFPSLLITRRILIQ